MVRRVPDKFYSIDRSKSPCVFNYTGGVSGPIGSGFSDACSAYYYDGGVFVLSVNYPMNYACVEEFLPSGKGKSAIFSGKSLRDKMGEPGLSYEHREMAAILIPETSKMKESTPKKTPSRGREKSKSKQRKGR